MLIFLTGMMGAGKSTLAPLLANHFNLPVFSTDRMIESSANKTISEIFREPGEDAFRALESDLLMNWNKKSGVVDTGGGFSCNPGAMEKMKSLGITVFLDVDTDELISRLSDNLKERPMLASDDWKGRLKELAIKRYDCYRQADITINNRGKAEGTVRELIRLIEKTY